MNIKRLTSIAICLGVIVLIVIYFSLYQKNKRIIDLESQGEKLVRKVEAYKKQYHKLPQYLEDMQLNLPDDYPLYYNITQDSGVYVISF